MSKVSVPAWLEEMEEIGEFEVIEVGVVYTARPCCLCGEPVLIKREHFSDPIPEEPYHPGCLSTEIAMMEIELNKIAQEEHSAQIDQMRSRYVDLMDAR